MQQNSEVKVTAFERGADGKFVFKPDPNAKSLHELMAQRRIPLELLRFGRLAKGVFLLEWEGNRIPKGVVLGTRTIANTKEGCVLDAEGAEIGIYERVLDSGCESRMSQKMLVFLK